MWGKWLLARAVHGARAPAASPGLGWAGGLPPAPPQPRTHTRSQLVCTQPEHTPASAQIPISPGLGPWQT